MLLNLLCLLLTSAFPTHRLDVEYDQKKYTKEINLNLNENVEVPVENTIIQ